MPESPMLPAGPDELPPVAASPLEPGLPDVLSLPALPDELLLLPASLAVLPDDLLPGRMPGPARAAPGPGALSDGVER